MTWLAFAVGIGTFMAVLVGVFQLIALRQDVCDLIRMIGCGSRPAEHGERLDRLERIEREREP